LRTGEDDVDTGILGPQHHVTPLTVIRRAYG
jgi:hypothetical protein